MQPAPNIHPLIQQHMTKFSGSFEAWQHQSENLQLFCAYYPAGTIIEPHNHVTDNCGVIIQGEIFITIDGIENSYKNGEWYEVAAGVVHSARTEQLTTEIEFWFKKS